MLADYDQEIIYEIGSIRNGLERIDNALEDGADVIIGGFITTDTAKKRNLPCIQIIRDCTSNEAKEIMSALHNCEGRIGDAAKALKISRSTLWRKMNNLGIKKNDYNRSFQ